VSEQCSKPQTRDLLDRSTPISHAVFPKKPLEHVHVTSQSAEKGDVNAAVVTDRRLLLIVNRHDTTTA
jgi:hypothetical protein